MWPQSPQAKAKAKGTTKAKTKTHPSSSRSLDECVSATVSGLRSTRGATLDDAPSAHVGASTEAVVAAGLGSDLEQVSSGFASYLPRGKRREAAVRAQLKAQGYAPTAPEHDWDEPELRTPRAQSLAHVYDAYGDADVAASAYDAYGADDADDGFAAYDAYGADDEADWTAAYDAYGADDEDDGAAAPSCLQRKTQRPTARQVSSRRQPQPERLGVKTRDSGAPTQRAPLPEPSLEAESARSSVPLPGPMPPQVHAPDPSVAAALSQRAQLEDEALRALLGTAYDVATGTRSLLGTKLPSEAGVRTASAAAGAAAASSDLGRGQPSPAVAGARDLVEPRDPAPTALPGGPAAAAAGTCRLSVSLGGDRTRAPAPPFPPSPEDVPGVAGADLYGAQLPPPPEASDYVPASEPSAGTEVPPAYEPLPRAAEQDRAAPQIRNGARHGPQAPRSTAARLSPTKRGHRGRRRPAPPAADQSAYLKDLDAAAATVGVVGAAESARTAVKDLDQSISSLSAPWEQETWGYSIELDDTGSPAVRAQRKYGRRRAAARFTPSSLEDSASSLTLPRGLQSQVAPETAAEPTGTPRGRRGQAARRGAAVSSLEDSASFVTLPLGLSAVGAEVAPSRAEPGLSAAAPAGTKAQAPSCGAQDGVSEEAQAYQELIRLLTAREYSAHELRGKLAARFGADAIAAALTRCQALGYQSDERYADLLVRHMRFALYGPQKLRLEAQRKGVAWDLVTAAMGANELDWDELAYQCLCRKYHAAQLLDFKTRGKANAYLVRRGFETSSREYALTRLAHEGADSSADSDADFSTDYGADLGGDEA